MKAFLKIVIVGVLCIVAFIQLIVFISEKVNSEDDVEESISYEAYFEPKLYIINEKTIRVQWSEDSVGIYTIFNSADMSTDNCILRFYTYKNIDGNDLVDLVELKNDTINRIDVEYATGVNQTFEHKFSVYPK
jgi:hypothetical protein